MGRSQNVDTDYDPTDFDFGESSRDLVRNFSWPTGDDSTAIIMRHTIDAAYGPFYPFTDCYCYNLDLFISFFFERFLPFFSKKRQNIFLI